MSNANEAAQSAVLQKQMKANIDHEKRLINELIKETQRLHMENRNLQEKSHALEQSVRMHSQKLLTLQAELEQMRVNTL
jgi:regulator of replication initiation timing